MIPKIIHYVHLGPSPRDSKELQSVWDIHPDWEYRNWHVGNLHELGLNPWDWEHSTYAGSSNIIRLHALARMGGVYLDTDVELLKPMDSLLSLKAFYARQPDKTPCNAVLGAEKGHPWILWMIENYGDQRKLDAAWGCHIMEQAPKEGVTELPSDTFYSWNWDSPEEAKIVSPNAIAIHHWAGSWTK